MLRWEKKCSGWCKHYRQKLGKKLEFAHSSEWEIEFCTYEIIKPWSKCTFYFYHNMGNNIFYTDKRVDVCMFVYSVHCTYVFVSYKR